MLIFDREKKCEEAIVRVSVEGIWRQAKETVRRAQRS
jgi:hypothetical protein